MHLNSRGDVAHGVGGGKASVNNVPFAMGAVGGWLDDDTVFFMNGDDNWYVSSYYIPTKKITRIEAVGATTAFAGNGVAVWHLASPQAEGGLYVADTTKPFLPVQHQEKWGLVGVGPDGAFAYKPSYQSNGPTLIHTPYTDTLNDYVLTLGTPSFLSLRGQGRAVWSEGFQIGSLNMPKPTVLSGAFWRIVVAQADSTDWVSYFHESFGIVLHDFDSFIGVPVLPQGDGWHTMRAVGINVIRVAISRTEGEQPGDVYVRDYDMHNEMVRDPWGGNTDWQPQVFVDVRVAKSATPFQPFARPKPFGFFEFNPRTSSTGLPGNVNLYVDRTEMLIRRNSDDKPLAQYVAAEVEGNTPQAFTDAIAAARLRHPELPVVAYWPPSLSFIPDCELPGIVAYWKKTETIGAFEARITAAILRLGARKVCLIAQCYTNNSEQATDLVALVPVYARLFRFSNVEMMLVFSGNGRATGYQDHPEVWEWWKSFSVANAGTIGDIIQMANPEITITEYSPNEGDAPLRVRAVCKVTDPNKQIHTLLWQYRPKGVTTWIVAAKNDVSDLDHTFLFTQPDTYEIRLQGVYNGGIAQTGMQRLVTVKAAVAAPQPQPDPIPTPTPEPEPNPTPEPKGPIRFVQTSGEFYFSARVDKPNTPLNAQARGTADYERLVFLPVDDDWTIFSVQKNMFLRAEAGGGGKLFFDRTVTGPYERFKINPVDGGVEIRTLTGWGLTAEGGGGKEINARKRPDEKSEPWETFTIQPPLKSAATGDTQKLSGRIRTNGRMFWTDAGIFRPRFMGALSALSVSDDQVQTYLDWVVEKNFNGVRTFAGALAWAGQTAQSARNRLPFLIEQCHDRDLYIEPSLITDSGTGFNVEEHVRICADICNQYDNVLPEIANEYFHPTQAEKVRDPRYLMELRKLIPSTLAVALGAGDSDEPTADVPQADWVSLHMDRGRDKWNMVRRVRELENASAQYNKPTMNNEPIGAAEAAIGGKRENDPAIYFTMGVLNRLFEVGGVHHADHALSTTLPGPNQEACAEAFVRGSLLIQTASRMRFSNANWPGSPVVGAAFGEGVVRAYSGLAEDGSENVLVLVGLTGDPKLQIGNGWRLGETMDEMPGVKVIRLER